MVEDEIARNEDKRSRILKILLLVVMLDAIGSFIMLPVTSRLYLPASPSASHLDKYYGLCRFFPGGSQNTE